MPLPHYAITMVLACWSSIAVGLAVCFCAVAVLMRD